MWRMDYRVVGCILQNGGRKNVKSLGSVFEKVVVAGVVGELDVVGESEFGEDASAKGADGFDAER